MSKKMWKKLFYTFAYGCYGVDYEPFGPGSSRKNE